MNLTEFGCTKAELSGWYRNCMIQDLRERLEKCRQGEYGEIGALRQFVRVALESLWQLGAKFPAIPSLPDYNPAIGLPESDRLLLPLITLEDIGTNVEELDRFERISSLMP